MKKLTERYKRWLLNRARSERKRAAQRSFHRKGAIKIRGAHQVTAWLGDSSEEIISLNAPVMPPRDLCFETAPEETLNFIGKVRDSLQLTRAAQMPGKYRWFRSARKPGGMRRIRRYVDFSQISHISTAAALILTAEYHRAAAIIGSAPPAIQLHEWSDEVFSSLFQIGFFEAIGHLESSDTELRRQGSIRSLRALNGTDGDDLARVSESIKELSQHLACGGLERGIRLDLNNAIGEAMVNVSKWAYPEDHTFDTPHLNEFWVTGSVDKDQNTLTVVIYDQGVSIPVSYPKKALKQKAVDYLKSLLKRSQEFAFQNDSAYIDCAMEFGNSQSGLEHRGQGLPQMKELIDQVGNGSLTVCSRGGLWQYEFGKPARRNSFESSVGGTLIEWKILLPDGEANGQ